MKRFFAVLMILSSVAVFAKGDAEEDKATEEQPSLFTDEQMVKLWEVWREAKKEGLVLYMMIAKAVNLDEDSISRFLEIIEMDGWNFVDFVNDEGVIPNMGIIFCFLWEEIMISKSTDAQKMEGLKILFKNCDAPYIAVDVRRLSEYENIF